MQSFWGVEMGQSTTACHLVPPGRSFDSGSSKRRLTAPSMVASLTSESMRRGWQQSITPWNRTGGNGRVDQLRSFGVGLLIVCKRFGTGCLHAS
jgi:hypothetical protein